MVIMVAKEEAGRIVEALSKCPYSRDAAIIGEVTGRPAGKGCHDYGDRTQALPSAAGRRALPRIC